MDWAHRFPDTLSYKPRASISDGDVVYGSLVSISARIEEYPSVVRGHQSGEEIVTSHKAACGTDIDPETRVWINSGETGDDSKALRILRKKRAKTLDDNYTLYIYTLGR